MAAQAYGARRALGMIIVLCVVLLAGCRGGPDTGGLLAGVGEMSEAEAARYASAEGRLQSEDGDVRQKAAVELLGMAHRHALKAVLDRMRQAPDAAVRVDMIQAAAFCRDSRCFDAVLGAVADADDSVKQAAASALSVYSQPEQVEAILELATSSSTGPRDRQLLMRAFGEGLCVQAVPALMDALQDDEPTVREAAWQALKQISGRDLPLDVQAWEAWWEANRRRTREDILEDRVWSLRTDLEASRRRNQELEEQLTELSALAKLPAAQAPERLLRALGSRHPGVRGYAAFRLSSLGPDALTSISLDDRAVFEALRAALADADPQIREDVVACAVKLKGRFASPLLLDALGDRDPKVVLRAIDAVNREMGEAAVQKLSAVMGSSDSEVRAAAANALGKLGSELAIEPLRKALGDAEENVRWFSVEGLRKLGATVAVPELCALLEGDPSPRVREITATALGGLGQPAAVPALRKALKDENERVRAGAVSALKALAKDDFELMTIIADILAEEGHHAVAAEVLRKAIAAFGGRPELEARLTAARRRLADVLKAQKDFLSAAAVYAELDRPTGGDPALRSAMVECWIAGGEPGRIVTAVEGWADGAKDKRLAEVVDVGTDAMRRLAAGGQERLAAQVLDLLLNAARAANDGALIQKLEQLKPPAPPAPPG